MQEDLIPILIAICIIGLVICFFAFEILFFFVCLAGLILGLIIINNDL